MPAIIRCAAVRNLIYTGGWAHPFERTAPVLARVLEAADVTSQITDRMATVRRALDLGNFDLFTVYACRFSMLDARYTEEQREEYAERIPPDVRTAIDAHVRRGGGVLALHTATLCFDDWPEWQQLIGGGWVWGQSFHPPLAVVDVEPAREHPIVHGVAHFVIEDEHYRCLDVASGSTVLAVAPFEGVAHPAMWTAGPRVFVDALGHDERSLTHPVHATVLRRAARWLTGAGDDAVQAQT
jgi:type 1 glutamine amidotransferase